MTKENVPDWFDVIPNLEFSSDPGWVFVNAWEDFCKLRDAMRVVGPCEKGVKEMRDRAITMMLAIKAQLMYFEVGLPTTTRSEDQQ